MQWRIFRDTLRASESFGTVLCRSGVEAPELRTPTLEMAEGMTFMSVRKHVVQIDRAKIVMIIHYREMSTSRTEVAREPHRVEGKKSWLLLDGLSKRMLRWSGLPRERKHEFDLTSDM